MDTSAPTNINVQSSPAPAKKVVDINQPQTCKNPGCGKTFKEKDNHDTACSYHPGPAVFHDRMRGVRYIILFKSIYDCVALLITKFKNNAFIVCLILQWKCCDIHVKEFDEFMGIPPCTKGWHNANPSS